MKLTEARLEEFRELYRHHFGVELSGEEALDVSSQLLRLMQIIYQPITKSAYENYNEKNDYELPRTGQDQPPIRG